MPDSNTTIKTNDVLLRENGNWLHFTAARQIIIAEKLEEVLPALREIEHLVEMNHWYAAGFLSYESASAFDSAAPTRAGSGFPYLWFGLYPKPRMITLPKPEGPNADLDWHPTTDRETYHTAIAAIRERIGDGRTYQVNYTMRLQCNFTGTPWDFFLQLAHNQNKHAAYVDMDRYAICSASPELFFQLDGGAITCRPMKGTARRGRTNAEDREQSEWLKQSAKNRAENVMIVDMVRNDLGRIAKLGSVSVPQLFETERYPTLWQMTSTVTANTSSSVTEIISALFPCASITGAPKVSTMSIIAELENTPRRIYTGSIGYISPQRKAIFNVAIRTALIDRMQQSAEYGVGGGIVWDSTSPEEYAEALLKARLLNEQSRPFSLLETMLWTPEENFFLLERHLARMLDSAAYFDIQITREKLKKYIDHISSGFHAPQRVRILLDQTGSLDSEIRPFALAESAESLKACLAREALDSDNPFLFHKTTRRDVYKAARTGLEEFDDVLLYNENWELTEFTIGNLVVELGGKLVTPPISCGVLPGTFRAHLLETGQVEERVLRIEQLGECGKIFRVNSIRKWEQVELCRESI